MENNELKKPSDIPAFPMDYAHQGYCMQQGMSLRDYFANSAMQSYFFNLELYKSTIKAYRCETDNDTYRAIAKISYLIADAMLNEREK